MRRITASSLDGCLVDDQRLRILFLWGVDCVNCDIAKAQMLQAPERFQWPDVDWLHDNVYVDRAMATRFALHGVPTFMVFHGTRKLGRITPWPGSDPFIAAIEAARQRLQPA
ncbi:MAG: hypothetical protein ACJ8GK_09785 [Luteimonas sp.]